MSKYKLENLIYFFLSLYVICTLLSMASMSIGIGLLAIFLTLYFANSKKPLSHYPSSEAKQLKWFSGFLLTTLVISLLGAKFFPLSINGNISQVHFLKDIAKAWYLFLPFILLFALKNIQDSEYKNIIRNWLLFSGVLFCIGIFQYFYGWPRKQWIPLYESRFHVTLFIGHHLSVASIFIFPFFACLDLLFSKESRPYNISKATLTGILIIGLIALYMTFSRTLWISLPIGILTFVYLRFSNRIRILATLALTTILFIAWNNPVIQNRFSNKDYFLGQRSNLWAANFDFIKARPLTGVGWHHNLELSAFKLDPKNDGNIFVGHAHNNLIEILSSTGTLGALAWILWCAWIFKTLFKLRGITHTQIANAPIFANGLIAAWITFHINGLTQVNFWEAKALHQIMWTTSLMLFWVELRYRASKQSIS